MNKASILSEVTYNDKRPAIKVLMDTNFTKEIRIALKKEQVMKEHQTPYPIVVQIVEGNIQFGVRKEIHHLKKGDLIALEGRVPHDLRALEDSIIRLTLTKGDQVKRVAKVIADN